MEIIPCHIYIVPYRGYHGNEGSPSESAFKSDLPFIFRDILQLKNQQQDTKEEKGYEFLQDCPIVLKGQSIGCALALYTFRLFQGDVQGVILENPFISLDIMLKSFLGGYLDNPVVKWFLMDHWDNLQEIQKIADKGQEAPRDATRNDTKTIRESFRILFMAAEQDEIVPPWHAFHLFKNLFPRPISTSATATSTTATATGTTDCSSWENLSETRDKDPATMTCEIQEHSEYIHYLPEEKAKEKEKGKLTEIGDAKETTTLRDNLQMILFKKGSHNDLWIQANYFRLIKQYLQDNQLL